MVSRNLFLWDQKQETLWAAQSLNSKITDFGYLGINLLSMPWWNKNYFKLTLNRLMHVVQNFDSKETYMQLPHYSPHRVAFMKHKQLSLKESFSCKCRNSKKYESHEFFCHVMFDLRILELKTLNAFFSKPCFSNWRAR